MCGGCCWLEGGTGSCPSEDEEEESIRWVSEQLPGEQRHQPQSPLPSSHPSFLLFDSVPGCRAHPKCLLYSPISTLWTRADKDTGSSESRRAMHAVSLSNPLPSRLECPLIDSGDSWEKQRSSRWWPLSIVTALHGVGNAARSHRGWGLRVFSSVVLYNGRQ